jgi:hypothetical protein
MPINSSVFYAHSSTSFKVSGLILVNKIKLKRINNMKTESVMIIYYTLLERVRRESRSQIIVLLPQVFWMNSLPKFYIKV